MSQPLYFYKFVSFDRRDILENGLIRFSPIGSFNDPFELEPTITPYSTRFLEYVTRLSPEERAGLEFSDADLEYSKDRVEKIEYYQKKYRSEVGKYGVLSLSSNNQINHFLTVSIPDKGDPRTNILMWSHYADSHRGFVIEFRPDFIDGIRLEKVEYCDERDCLTFEDIEENRFERIFFKKSPEWRYEQEYRAVLPLNKASKIHNEKFHLYKINKSSINSITFGCAMGDEEKKIIINLVKGDPELKAAKMNHARLNDEGFFLDFYYDDGRVTNNHPFGLMRIPSQRKL
jgi:hypothetical protein